MGWTSMPLNIPVKQWFKEYWENGSSDYEVLDSALVNFTELYGAIKVKSTGEVICAAFKVQFSPKDEYNFMYKAMTESVGPVIDNCPKRIFNLLTPLDPENTGYALEWRKRVEAKHKKRETIRKLTCESIIKTSEPLYFGDLGKFYFFRKAKLIRYRNIWEALNEKFEPVFKARINLKDYDFEVVN